MKLDKFKSILKECIREVLIEEQLILKNDSNVIKSPSNNLQEGIFIPNDGTNPYLSILKETAMNLKPEDKINYSSTYM